MIRNHFGSLIGHHGHFMLFRAWSDPSLPFLAIDKHGAGYPTINSIYCKYLNNHRNPSKTEQARYALFKKTQIELGH
jgi:hypothetical protein